MSLTKERENSSLDVKQLTYFLNGGKEKTENKNKWSKIIENDPIFSLQDKPFLSRKNEIKRAHQKCLRFHQLLKKYSIEPLSEDFWILFSFINDHVPLFLHYQLFIPTLMGQASDEQLKKWLPLALNLEILGCYAQTEIGHGSNVKGIETISIYHPEAQEFEIYSPTLSSTKFWVGALGIYSTHAVVFAQLIIKGKNYGVHPFFVQLRSLEDHTPLKGIKVGDIGPKFGFSSQDNGYLTFDHIRIPRENMLMKFSRVEKDGTYVKPPHDKLTYGVMSYMRVNFVSSSSHFLSKAVTIAIRYSAQRKQFGSPEELQVLNYPTQQYKLFPILSLTFAIHFTGLYMKNLYEKSQNLINEGNFTFMTVFHSVLSGLKSLITAMVSESIEDCRKSCGGHGYNKSSGLPELYSFYVHFCTAEGDNTLLSLQLGKFLSHCYKLVSSGNKLQGIMGYLSQPLEDKCQAHSKEDFLNPDIQLAAFQHIASRYICETFSQKQVNEIDMSNTSKYHSLYMMVFCFINSLKSISNDVKPIMKTLCDLFCLSQMEKECGMLLEDGYLTKKQLDWVKENVRNLLNVIRKDAVPLVDSFNHSDHSLNSVLGCYDGNYEKRIMDYVDQNPINQKKVFDSYQDYIRPLIYQSKL